MITIAMQTYFSACIKLIFFSLFSISVKTGLRSALLWKDLEKSGHIWSHISSLSGNGEVSIISLGGGLKKVINKNKSHEAKTIPDGSNNLPLDRKKTLKIYDP